MLWPVPESIAPPMPKPEHAPPNLDMQVLYGETLDADQVDQLFTKKGKLRSRPKLPPEATRRRGAELVAYQILQDLGQDLNPHEYGELLPSNVPLNHIYPSQPTSADSHRRKKPIRLYFTRAAPGEQPWYDAERHRITTPQVRGCFVLLKGNGAFDPNGSSDPMLFNATFPLQNSTIEFVYSSIGVSRRRVRGVVQLIVQHPRAAKRAIGFVLEQLQLI